MEFAWTGTVVYGIHTVAVKEGTIELEPVVERQPRSGNSWLLDLTTDQGRLFSQTCLCRCCSTALYCLPIDL